MKNLVYFIAVMVLAGCTGEPQYVLTGALDGVNGAKTILLRKHQGGEWVDVDSVTTSTGAFSFKGQVEYPEMYFLMVKGERSRVSFFLENSKIKIEGHVDSLSVAKIHGSKTQAEYDAFNEKVKVFGDHNRELYGAFQKAKSEGDQAVMTQLEGKMEQLYEDMQSFRKDYIKNNPASWISPVILQQLLYQLSGDELKVALGQLDVKFKDLAVVKEMQVHAQKLETVAVGRVAPNFSQNDPEGKAVNLSDYRGKFLLIDFWASWCGPCRRENPNVVAVYNDYKDKGFDVLGVSLDRMKDNWVKAIEEDQLTWTHVSDLKYWSNEAAQQYAIKSIPSNLLLNKDGVIVAKNLRGEDLRAKISELLD